MTPIFDSTRIKATISEHLKKAIKSIDLAVAWFTDRDLADHLSAAALFNLRNFS